MTWGSPTSQICLLQVKGGVGGAQEPMKVLGRQGTTVLAGGEVRKGRRRGRRSDAETTRDLVLPGATVS